MNSSSSAERRETTHKMNDGSHRNNHKFQAISFNIDMMTVIESCFKDFFQAQHQIRVGHTTERKGIHGTYFRLTFCVVNVFYEHLLMMLEIFSKRCVSLCGMQVACAITRKVVLSNNTTSSAPQIVQYSFKCDSRRAVLGTREYTI